MSSNLFSFLTFIDIFGYKPIIYVKGESNFKSTYGGILTIFVSLSFISLCVVEMYEYFNSNIPTEIQRKEQIPNYSLSLNKTNYLLAYKIDFPEKTTENFDFNKFIKIDILLHYEKLDPNFYTNSSNIIFTNCTNFNLDEFLLSETKKNILINKAICIDLNNTILKNSEINGKSILEVSINRNQSYLMELGILDDYEFWMQPNEKYSDIWSKYNLTIFYQALMYSPSKYNINPVQKIIHSEKREFYFDLMQDYSLTITTLKSKKQRDLFRKYKYSSEDIYYDSVNFIQIDPELHEYDDVNNDFIRIISYTINLDNNVEFHILKYQSFIQFISEIGVTMNFIFTVFKYIFSFFQQVEEIHYLIDTCFNDFNNYNNDNKDLSCKKITFKKDNKQYNENKSKNNNSSNNMIIQENNKTNINNNFILSKIEKEPKNKLSFLAYNNQEQGNTGKNKNKNLVYSSNNIASLKKKIFTLKPNLNYKNINININSKKDSNIEMNVAKKDIYYCLLGSKKKFYAEKFKKYVSFENIIKYNEEWENYKMYYLSKEKNFNCNNNINLVLNREENEINKIIKKDIISQYDIY